MASKNLQRNKTQRFQAEQQPTLSPRSGLACPTKNSSSLNPKKFFLKGERDWDEDFEAWNRRWVKRETRASRVVMKWELELGWCGEQWQPPNRRRKRRRKGEGIRSGRRGYLLAGKGHSCNFTREGVLVIPPEGVSVILRGHGNGVCAF
ncbi:hypothetical protein TRIUR3_09517 [Triticum urartu]|uniref:Uncharacterized protein n=1 Tax=Triticum urartu TaxID=4572 RepID=M7ZLD9_TRIUA|nr:hypothetical protein TRIUR3_09517 [Triticum urartu]